MVISNMEDSTERNLKLTDIFLINRALPDDVSEKYYW